MTETELVNTWNETVRVEKEGRDKPDLINATQQRINDEYTYAYKFNPKSVKEISEKQIKMVKSINQFETDAEAIEHISK